MDQILLGLHEVEGVRGTVVFDASGRILRHRAHAIYDLALLEQVSHALVKAIASVQRYHQDWDQITAQFQEGKIIVRNVGQAKLAVVADSSLNPSFANVAIRVAVNKLKAAIQSGGLPLPLPKAVALPTSSAVTPAPAAPISPASAAPIAPVLAAPAAPVVPAAPTSAPSRLSSSGLSWSGLGAAGAATSTVSVADAGASELLTRCATALAKSVGPMAKVFVKEAVRKISPAAPFSAKLLSQLVAELEAHIHDPGERTKFRKELGLS